MPISDPTLFDGEFMEYMDVYLASDEKIKNIYTTTQTQATIKPKHLEHD